MTRLALGHADRARRAPPARSSGARRTAFRRRAAPAPGRPRPRRAGRRPAHWLAIVPPLTPDALAGRQFLRLRDRGLDPPASTNVNHSPSRSQPSGTLCESTTTGFSIGCLPPQAFVKSNSLRPHDRAPVIVHDLAQCSALASVSVQGQVRVVRWESRRRRVVPREQVLEAAVSPGRRCSRRATCGTGVDLAHDCLLSVWSVFTEASNGSRDFDSRLEDSFGRLLRGPFAPLALVHRRRRGPPGSCDPAR